MIRTIPRSEFGNATPEAIRTKLYRQHAKQNERASVYVTEDAVQVHVVPMTDFALQRSLSRIIHQMRTAAKVRNWKWLAELTVKAKELAELAEHRKLKSLEVVR